MSDPGLWIKIGLTVAMAGLTAFFLMVLVERIYKHSGDKCPEWVEVAGGVGALAAFGSMPIFVAAALLKLWS